MAQTEATAMAKQSFEPHSKQAPHREGSRRRQGKSGAMRGSRKGMNLTGSELEDLLKASELVPEGCSNKHSVDVDTLSTAEPSSAEHTPELNCMVSEMEAWPSLREAVEKGWDFCSEGSDDEDLWEDLPTPALAMEDDIEKHLDQQPKNSWWLVPGSGSCETEPVNSEAAEDAKSTFADLLRDQKSNAQPPAAGYRSAAPPSRRSGHRASGSEDEVIPEELQRIQRHGWKKEHKASWNTKQLRKVAEHKAQKVMQSCQSRGWLEDEAEKEEA